MVDYMLSWFFQILLGEGYYAERTSKQTVEILNRRGKVLESKVDSLKAMMMDLKAEASFFDATAAEAVVSYWILTLTFDFSVVCSTYLIVQLVILLLDVYNRKDSWRLRKIMLRKILQRV